ncbi:hypothetical protein DXA02_00080 [Ruminococcus sp. AM54-1NS]|nr:hypothetical protein DXA02_00080 [Ruminococcus sp. AM54-1NS]
MCRLCSQRISKPHERFSLCAFGSRIKHMCETYDLSWPEADKLIKRVDRQRHNYYKYVTGKNRGDRDNKHLMIDVSEYGTDLTAEMICFAARKMFED